MVNKEYLDRVIDQLISETEIDWRDIKSSSYGRDTNRRNTIRVQSFFYDADFFHLFSDPDPEQNRTFHRYFTKHCREVYGLTEKEIDYIWKEYINSIIYTIKNG